MEQFVLKIPGNGRRSFSLLKRTWLAGKAKHKKFSCNEIAELNLSYRQNKLSLVEAVKHAKRVRSDEYRRLRRAKAELVFNFENEKLLNHYLKSEYETRELVDSESLVNDFRRAIHAVGRLSLQVASREELQREISKVVKGNKQRRVVARLNSILKFCNRSFKLKKDRRVKPIIKYLSLAEFSKVLSSIEQPTAQQLAQAAFHTGCRVGELFALKPEHIKVAYVVVGGQMDRAGQLRETKNHIERRAYVIPEGRECVKQWAAIEKKDKLRNSSLSKMFKRACAKVFPDNRDKWCVFHDLRHSYACHLLSRGVSLSLVSQSLGNSVTVCQEHYSGYVLRDESIEAIDVIMRS